MSDALSLPPSVPQSLSASVPSPHWLDLPAAAALTGQSERNLRYRCGETYLAAGQARLFSEPGSGKKPRWQIRSDADPKLSLTPAANSQIVIADRFKLLPQAAREKALNRARILAEWKQWLNAAEVQHKDRDETTQAFILFMASKGEKLSRPTLYNWAKAHKQDGLMGLVDARTPSDETTARGDPFLEQIKELWLCEQKVGVSVCYTAAKLLARHHGWSICTYRTASRFIAEFAEKNAAIVIARRGGPEAFNNEVARYITRDYSGVESNEIWNADHHQFDVLVKISERLNTKTGELVPVYRRPWITGWQDVRSRKLVAWVIYAEDPNTDPIITTLVMGSKSHGIPKKAYTDNGRDFDNWILTGETKAMRWKRRRMHVAHDQAALGSIYAGMNIEHLHAWPWHGQSKPIERAFGTICGRFSKTFLTYCGRTPSEKPECLAPNLESGKAPTLAEFIAKFSVWVEADYNQKHHTGDAMDCTPAVAWEANLIEKRTMPHDQIDLVCERPSARVENGGFKYPTVGQNGVVYKKIWYGQMETAHLLGQKVRVTAGESAGHVNIWSLEGQWLCVAKANLSLAFNATQTMVSAKIAETKKANKIIRQAARLKPRMAMDLTDLVNEAAAEAAQQQAEFAAPTNPTPPGYKPIRSDLEAQMPAIRAGHEVPLKKAVGDGTPAPSGPSRFQYAPSANAEDSDSSAAAGSGFIYHGGAISEDES